MDIDKQIDIIKNTLNNSFRFVEYDKELNQITVKDFFHNEFKIKSKVLPEEELFSSKFLNELIVRFRDGSTSSLIYYARAIYSTMYSLLKNKQPIHVNNNVQGILTQIEGLFKDIKPYTAPNDDKYCNHCSDPDVTKDFKPMLKVMGYNYCPNCGRKLL